ncbi:MAG: sigma-70 family RNA polymerase sigma factor [Desulfurella sp.]|uniref:sigma-70 family RNA polymerase sigma factor n=1 Tax=Desulfurella sp. TaxID=1962857 RepID=UPI003CB467F5
MEKNKVKIKQKETDVKDSLNQYLDEISKIPLLTKEEEIDLAKKVQKGDKEALKKLVKHNLRFVVSIAQRYRNFGVPISDLINEGNIGLIKAASKFDPDKNIKFISYAVWWIKQSILKTLSEQTSPIKIPIKARAKSNKLSYIKEAYFREFGEEMANEEVSKVSGFSEKEIKDIEVGRLKFNSLDKTIGEDGDNNLLDVLEDQTESVEDKYVYESSVNTLKKLLKLLPQRQQNIIKMRFGLDVERRYTLDEIGEKYNISKERVRQIEKEALIKLKKMFDR